jgi:hypothetical protein
MRNKFVIASSWRSRDGQRAIILDEAPDGNGTVLAWYCQEGELRRVFVGTGRAIKQRRKSGADLLEPWADGMVPRWALE